MLGKIYRFIKKCFILGFILGVPVGIALTLINYYVYKKAEPYVITAEEAANEEEYDCIIILGASVADTTPSAMLEARLLKGIQLYEKGCAPKIIMSGDHGGEFYNEVGAMKKFAIKHGVPSEDIFMDHAGFSTYETMYRAKEIFGAKRVLIVTQRYHMTRAVYIANELGLDAKGVATNWIIYGGEKYRSVREYLAIGKDFFTTKIKMKPSLMGETISLQENGDITDDKDMLKD